MKKENIIDIITDEDGRKIVVITDIRFKGKRNIDWEDVENYLKEYVGKCYEVVETADQVFIGNDFPAELKGSEDTKRLCGANAKAKANAETYKTIQSSSMSAGIETAYARWY